MEFNLHKQLVDVPVISSKSVYFNWMEFSAP